MRKSCDKEASTEDKRPSLTNETTCDEKYKEPFDPYDYGEQDGISQWGATVHLIRSSVGSGILVMPYAMKNLGYVTGSVLMLLVSLVYFHTVSMLITTEYQMCKLFKMKYFSYIGLADKLFEMAPFPLSKLRRFVRYLMYFYFGLPVGGAAWLVVMSGSLQNVAHYFNMDFKITHIVTALIFPLTFCCMFNRLLRILVPYSALTNCMSLVMALIVVSCSILYGSPKPNVRPIGSVSFIPQGIALFVETLRITAAIIPLKNDMQHPRKLGGISGAVSITAVALTMLYTGFGVICYANYGDEVHDNILFNLPSNDLILFITNLLYTAEMFVAYVLTFYLYFLNIWSAELQENLKGSKYKYVVEYSIRLGYILFGYFICIGVPNLGLISSLSGIAGIVVELALPSVLQLLFVLTHKSKSCWLIVKNLCIITFSAVLFVMSIVSCVQEIIKLYST